MSQFTSNSIHQTPAESMATLVVMMFQGAIHVAEARAVANTLDPTPFPGIPKEAADSAWWARRTLSRLADLGVTPDGWEEAFFCSFMDAGEAE